MATMASKGAIEATESLPRLVVALVGHAEVDLDGAWAWGAEQIL